MMQKEKILSDQSQNESHPLFIHKENIPPKISQRLDLEPQTDMIVLVNVV